MMSCDVGPDLSSVALAKDEGLLISINPEFIALLL